MWALMVEECELVHGSGSRCSRPTIDACRNFSLSPHSIEMEREPGYTPTVWSFLNQSRAGAWCTVRRKGHRASECSWNLIAINLLSVKFAD